MNRTTAIKSERTGVTYEVRAIRSDGFLVFIIVSAFIIGALLFLMTPGFPLSDGRKVGFDVLPYFPTMAIVGVIWLVVTGIAVYGIFRLNERDKLIQIIKQTAEESPGDNNIKVSDLEDLSVYQVSGEFPMLGKDLEITTKVDNFKERMKKLDLLFYSEEGQEGLGTLDLEQRVALKNLLNNQYEELSREIAAYPGLKADLLSAKKSMNRSERKLKPQAPKRTPRTPPNLPLKITKLDYLPGGETKFRLSLSQLFQPKISRSLEQKAEIIRAQRGYRENAEAAAKLAGDRNTIRYTKDGAVYSGPRRYAEGLSREPRPLKARSRQPEKNFRPKR